VTEDDISRAAAILSRAERVAVMTGAGVSAESGVPTFRGAGGLWEGRPVAQVATPEGFAADPVLVWRFYEERRRAMASVQPNPAHLVLARWQDRFAELTLITQNVDGLHAVAGSRRVLELHGTLWRVRCSGCGRERDERTVPLARVPPVCAACGALERPAVVWFGEMLPEEVVAAAWQATEACDAFLVVGTSAVVYPAAGLVQVAASHGARVIEFNPEASALAHLAHVAVRGPAGVTLPAVAAILDGA